MLCTKSVVKFIEGKVNITCNNIIRLTTPNVGSIKLST